MKLPIKLPTASVSRWVRGSRSLLPFTSPISSTRGRDDVLDKLLIFTPSPVDVKGGNKGQPKPPLASLMQLHYPLSSPDNNLLQEYTLPPQISSGNTASSLRYNEDLLIEDMDMFAADVACRHVGGLDDKRLVTAHLERLEVMCHHHPLSRLPLAAGANSRPRTDIDLELSGQVVWVGRSSMEVLLEVCTALPKQVAGQHEGNQEESGNAFDESIHMYGTQPDDHLYRQLVGRAQFVMATRTPDLTRAMQAQPLLPTNAHEESLFKEVLERTERKKRDAQQRHHQHTHDEDHTKHLSPHDPLTQEQHLVCMQSRGADALPMSSTARSQLVTTRYQDRNTTGSVFGGQLICYGTAIGSDVATAHAGQPCHLVQLHDVAFIALAPLDCRLVLEGHVAYAEGPLMHVRAVVRRLSDHSSGAQKGAPAPGAYVTTFWCTYTTASGDGVASVTPSTQAEFRDWSHAKSCIPLTAPAGAKAVLC
ncbi:hypothetical protein DUNSADRAFT_12031 [Dunaliella salina]|uniref:HotDog ACOT-type domain-containing protein n=1 Tax=Dunaliella salina TaxID=3046 RepID=A0ABQ7GC34_DUNSA|nr:hypothetical protein DUNSADRAFT_12031 [Dunaliella salina]|eukprot:KAF5832162.1 hypothetical protein DUNSADRAFT_12031 [Dunaliella salina]